MNTRSQVLLWGAQRASAMLLAVCVLVHLITIIYAVRHGLSAAEILGRTRGSVAWGLFYATFVAAVAPNVTVAPERNPVPVIVTDVPPAVVPDVVASAVTVGTTVV